jgi:hypothetical protein
MERLRNAGPCAHPAFRKRYMRATAKENKSFLVLFFKKERLPSQAAS